MRSRLVFFHLLTGDIFTAGYHDDGMDPCVCGSIWFLWMFHQLCHSSPLYWCISTLMGIDAVKITVHDASTLCVQLIIHKVRAHIMEWRWFSVTRGRESETGSETGAACERAQSEDCVLKRPLSEAICNVFIRSKSSRIMPSIAIQILHSHIL